MKSTCSECNKEFTYYIFEWGNGVYKKRHICDSCAKDRDKKTLKKINDKKKAKKEMNKYFNTYK